MFHSILSTSVILLNFLLVLLSLILFLFLCSVDGASSSPSASRSLSSAPLPSSSFSYFFLFLPFLLYWLLLPSLLPLVASSFCLGFSFLLRSFLFFFFLLFLFRIPSFFAFSLFSLAFCSSGFLFQSGFCFYFASFSFSAVFLCGFSSVSSLFLFCSPFACRSLFCCSSLFLSSTFSVGVFPSLLCFLVPGFSSLLLAIAGIPPCPVDSSSFGSLRVCFSASVPDAFHLLRLFPFSSCRLTCGLSSSFSTVAQLYFVLFCCLFLLVARIHGSFLSVRCLLFPLLLGCFCCVGNPASRLSLRLCWPIRVDFSSVPPGSFFLQPTGRAYCCFLCSHSGGYSLSGYA